MPPPFATTSAGFRQRAPFVSAPSNAARANLTAPCLQVQYEAADDGQAFPRCAAGATNQACSALSQHGVVLLNRHLLLYIPKYTLYNPKHPLLSFAPLTSPCFRQLAKGSADHTKLSNYEKADKGAGALAGDFARVMEDVMQLRCCKSPRASLQEVDSQLTRMFPKP